MESALMTTTTIPPVYVKLREKGSKQWGFLSSKGGVTHLRIHAARFANAEKAQTLIDTNAADNPDWEWKVVS
jgi:hypothetical protein